MASLPAVADACFFAGGSRCVKPMVGLAMPVNTMLNDIEQEVFDCKRLQSPSVMIRIHVCQGPIGTCPRPMIFWFSETHSNLLSTSSSFRLTLRHCLCIGSIDHKTSTETDPALLITFS